MGSNLRLGGFDDRGSHQPVQDLPFLIVAISWGVAKAYQAGPSAIIATLDYTYLVFAAFWSFVIFSEVPDIAIVVAERRASSLGCVRLK